MKSIFLLVSIISFAACGQNPKQKGDTETTIKKEIVVQIKSYYQKQYNGTRLEETETDSIINLVYHNNPKSKEENDGFLIDISIPKKVTMDLFNANPILNGDINNDKIDDIVLTVHTEGGGGGGNIASQDIFVFLNVSGKYLLTSITPDGEISGCNGPFRAKKIQEGYLIGSSSCYAEGDPRCCPSLVYETKVQFKNKSLHFNSKEIKSN